MDTLHVIHTTQCLQQKGYKIDVTPVTACPRNVYSIIGSTC